jgi:hypothetical protein
MCEGFDARLRQHTDITVGMEDWDRGSSWAGRITLKADTVTSGRQRA